MDADSVTLLHRATAKGGRSLLQYVSEACPWTTDQTKGEFKEILAFANEERDAVSKMMRYLQKQHQRRVVFGSYPSHYTTMNYVTIDHLLPKLVADTESQIAELDKASQSDSNSEVHAMIRSFVQVKRRHLAALKMMMNPQEKAIA